MISFNNLGNLGRLGNQMFQYASLKGIAVNRGFDYIVPPEEVFGVSDSNVKKSDSNIHTTFNLKKCRMNISNNKMIQESGFNFDETLFNFCEDNVDLYGYFQSEKYFKHIEDDIRNEFTFNQDLINSCKNLILTEVESTEIISLHIRRSDYIDLHTFHPTLSMKYYAEALEKFPAVPVFIFSDDPNWCMEQELFDEDRFLVSTNTSDFDMCLMSMCTHHIIANSSFSWWGAWLSGSKNVIAPKVWFGPSLSDHDTLDLYCEGWETL